MKTILFASCLFLAAQQVSALSCIRPDPVTTFNRLAEAPEPYHVLYGQLTFDEAALTTEPIERGFDNPNPVPIPAFFRGKGLQRDGFTSDYIGPAILQISCVDPWCGSTRSGVDAVFFVRADSDPVQMDAKVCGGMIFEEPGQETLDALKSCMRGEDCLPAPFE